MIHVEQICKIKLIFCLLTTHWLASDCEVVKIFSAQKETNNTRETYSELDKAAKLQIFNELSKRSFIFY